MILRYYGVPKDAEYGDKFMGRFPILFQERTKDMTQTCMCWGIECPKGWYHILEQLCTVLEFYNMEFVKNYNVAIVADQVKEKYGTLRFYFTIRTVDDNGVIIPLYDENNPPENMTNVLDANKHRLAADYLEMLADNIIREADQMTEDTCAVCGVPLDKDNKVETKGWISYICKHCHEHPDGEDEDEGFDEREEKGDEAPVGEV